MFVLFVLGCNSQTWIWAKNSVCNNGSGSDEGYSVSTDLSGNVFVTGNFQCPSISFGSYTLTNSGGSDIYIVKYDTNGNVMWAKKAGGSGIDLCFSVTTDQNGNSIITGQYSSPTIVFGTYTLTNPGVYNVFIAKYDPNGNILWANSCSGSGNDCANSVSTDLNGNIFIAGDFNSPSLIIGTYTLTYTPGTWSAFLIKFDSNGNVLWAKKSIGSFVDIARSVCTDSGGNSFITGNFGSPTIIFGTYSLTNTGSTDIFIVKFDPNGNVIWVKSALGSATFNEDSYSVSTDPNGNAYITGKFESPILTFGSYTLSNSGGSDAFLAKYSPLGNLLWAKSATGPSGEIGYSVSSYSDGVFVCGSMGAANNTMIIGSTTITAQNGTDPMYIANYDINGNVTFATALASGGDDRNCVAVDKFCNVYIGSDYTMPLSIGTTTLPQPTGGESVFVAKLKFCQFVAVNEIQKNTSTISLYPNPNYGIFEIKINGDLTNTEIVISNSIGQIVHRQKIIKEINLIKTNNLTAGLYNCSLYQNGLIVSGHKFITE